ncbi:hypothetical protein BH10BAC2_BH10BAC2_32960 [soil metagenome]
MKRTSKTLHASFIYLLFLVVIISCKEEVGTLSGTAFYKDITGENNKADAGSNVFLFSLFDSSFQKINECDIKGSFKIEKIPIGTYLVIIESKNTHENPCDFLNRLCVQSINLRKLNLWPLNENEYLSFKDQYTRMMNIPSSSESVLDTASTENLLRFSLYQNLNSIAVQLIGNLKNYYSNKSIILTPTSPNKIYIKKVEIEKDQTQNVIADFDFKDF